jgi:hypothetical protein
LPEIRSTITETVVVVVDDLLKLDPNVGEGAEQALAVLVQLVATPDDLGRRRVLEETVVREEVADGVGEPIELAGPAEVGLADQADSSSMGALGRFTSGSPFRRCPCRSTSRRRRRTLRRS